MTALGTQPDGRIVQPSGSSGGPGSPTAAPGATGAARIPSIDGFRGAAVLLMALGNFELGVRAFPAAIKHAQGIGYTVADVVAPMFVIAIALTVGPSVRRRAEEQGTAAALQHLASRALALIGIGAVISAGQAIVAPISATTGSWGVLQCLGASTLLLVPVILLPPRVRVAVGIGLLVLYQWLFDTYWADLVPHLPHNGLPGVLAWAGLLVITTAVGDAYHAQADAGRARLLVRAGVLAGALALVLARWIPIAKTWASATYMLLSLGLCLLVLAAFHLALDPRPSAALWLQRIGRNPLVLYLVNLVLLALFTLPSADWWHAGASIGLTLWQAALIAAGNIGLAAYLDRRGWIVKL